MRCSSSATRFFSAGSCRNTADDFSQSRFGDRRIAGDELARLDRVGDAASAPSRSRPCRCAGGRRRRPARASITSSSIDRAAGDADLRGQQHAAADRDAVRDLHEVVDLRAGADPRLADRRPIDRRVGADLDVVFDDDVGVLRDLQVRAVRLPREAEAVAADDGAVVQRSTRLPMTTRSRIETCEWMTQSSPMRAPAPMTTFGIDDRCARRSTRRRRSMTNGADRDAVADRGVGGDDARADRCPCGGVEPARTGRPRARTPGRDRSARSTAHRGGGALPSASRATITADARVVASCGAYFALATKVRSPGSACSMPATRTISRSPSPSRRQCSRSAISRSFKAFIMTAPARRDAIEKRGEARQLQAGGDRRRRAMRARRAANRPARELVECRLGAEVPLRRAPREAPRHDEEVADDAERRSSSRSRWAPVSASAPPTAPSAPRSTSQPPAMTARAARAARSRSDAAAASDRSAECDERRVVACGAATTSVRCSAIDSASRRRPHGTSAGARATTRRAASSRPCRPSRRAVHPLLELRRRVTRRTARAHRRGRVHFER